jgi:hypothetical protein
LTSALTLLEIAVATAIARQFPNAHSALICQLASATVTGREFTPFGFYTEFEVSRSAPSALEVDGVIGSVGCEVGPDSYPFEFVLYIRDGYAGMIEAYSFGDGYGDIDLLIADFDDPRPVPVPAKARQTPA